MAGASSVPRFSDACEEGERLLAAEESLRVSMKSAPWDFITGKHLAKAIADTQIEQRQHSCECQTCIHQETREDQAHLEACKRRKDTVPWPAGGAGQEGRAV